MKKVNITSYKDAMSKFATGITVITINNNNRYFGKTVNSFSALSLKPPLILFSLDKKASYLKEFVKSRFIGINFLSKKQKKISLHFSNKNSKWNSNKYFLSNNKTPLLNDSLVNLCCKNIKKLKNGDHIIFICEIIDLKINDLLEPLIYVNKKFY